MNVEIWIQNGTKAYQPAICSGITLESKRTGTPSTLKFTAIQDDVLKISEGNPVRMTVDGTKMFFGFIFKIARDKTNKVQITAYDQIIYLKKNKDTYVYSNLRTDQLIKMIANDFALNVGQLENSGHTSSRADDNKTLLDIIQNSLDDTLTSTGNMYVLYDDFGSLTLKNVENMFLNLLIDAETGQNFTYTSSIEDETYNQIKLTYDNEKTGKREVYIARDSSTMNDWGVLQYYESIQNPNGAKAKADALLSLYNAKTKNLKVTGAFGDLRVRAGCSVVVQLDLIDVKVQNLMMVENVKHTFNTDFHTMDLTLRGGGFVA